jgi:CRP/FNR family transcriptional regulator, cyclic AMP receptor protein
VPHGVTAVSRHRRVRNTSSTPSNRGVGRGVRVTELTAPDSTLPYRARMRTNDDHTTLRSVPGFDALDSADLDALSRASLPTQVTAGTVLMTEGRPGREAFIVTGGSVEIRHGDDVVAVVGPGQFVGEMSVLDGGPRSATAVAVTDTQLLVMSVPDMRRLLDGSPAIARRVMTALSTRLRDQH